MACKLLLLWVQILKLFCWDEIKWTSATTPTGSGHGKNNKRTFSLLRWKCTFWLDFFSWRKLPGHVVFNSCLFTKRENHIFVRTVNVKWYSASVWKALQIVFFFLNVHFFRLFFITFCFFFWPCSTSRSK